MRLRVTICGSGNSAHVLAGLGAARPELEVRVFTRDTQKAARWSSILAAERLSISKREGDEDRVVSSANPLLVTDRPELAAKDCDMIVLAVPAFAHTRYLELLAPFIEDGVVVVGLPGQGGFESEVRQILDSRPVVILNFESLPWSCVVVDFGRHARIRGTKARLVGALRGDLATSRVLQPFDVIREMVGNWTEVIESSSMLAITLMSISAYTHPPIMYSTWRNWDGTPLAEPPLFYHSVDRSTAELLTRVSAEGLAISRRIMEQYPGEDLSHVMPMLEWDRTRYGHVIDDNRDQLTVLRTNRAYATSRHPMKRVKGGYVPDFQHRYLSEDVPFGLVAVRGIAALAGVATPAIDEVLVWSQARLGRQYLVGAKLTGADLKSTRAPQRYGYETLGELL